MPYNRMYYCAQQSRQQDKVGIGPNNSLVPNKWQAITWTDVDPIHWSVSPGFSGLKWQMLAKLIRQNGRINSLHCVCAGASEGTAVTNSIHHMHMGVGGRTLQNVGEFISLGALTYSLLNKLHIYQCMDKIFCVEFQRVPLKFHT